MDKSLLVKRISLGLAVLTIFACGGGSDDSGGHYLSKSIETHYNNNSGVGAKIQVNAFTPVVVAAGQSEVASHNVTLNTSTSAATWTATAFNPTTDQVIAGPTNFVWTAANAQPNSKLDINFNGTAITFNPEP